MGRQQKGRTPGAPAGPRRPWILHRPLLNYPPTHSTRFSYLNGASDALYAGAADTGVRKDVDLGRCGAQTVAYYHQLKDGVDYVFVGHPSYNRWAKAWRFGGSGGFEGCTGPTRMGAAARPAQARAGGLQRPAPSHPHPPTLPPHQTQPCSAGTPYGDEHGTFGDNQFRFALLSLAACEAPLVVPVGPEKSPYGDKVAFIANDWHAGLVPLYVSSRFRRHGVYTDARCVFVIHNLSHQGVEPKITFDTLGLPDDAYDPLSWRYPDWAAVTGPAVNVLKGAVVASDRVVTVSGGYAWEIQTPEGGWGLDGVLRERAHVLNGVTNGVDIAEWDPTTDPDLPAHYGPGAMAGKAACKAALQAELGFAVDPDAPLVGWIGRLDYQKGPDLVLEAASGLAQRGVQTVMLGSGSPELEARMAAAEAAHPAHFRGWRGFSVPVAHRIIAGADLLLMPSRFEPCGLNQVSGGGGGLGGLGWVGWVGVGGHAGRAWVSSRPHSLPPPAAGQGRPPTLRPTLSPAPIPHSLSCSPCGTARPLWPTRRAACATRSLTQTRRPPTIPPPAGCLPRPTRVPCCPAWMPPCTCGGTTGRGGTPSRRRACRRTCRGTARLASTSKSWSGPSWTRPCGLGEEIGLGEGGEGGLGGWKGRAEGAGRGGGRGGGRLGHASPPGAAPSRPPRPAGFPIFWWLALWSPSGGVGGGRGWAGDALKHRREKGARREARRAGNAVPALAHSRAQSRPARAQPPAGPLPGEGGRRPPPGRPPLPSAPGLRRTAGLPSSTPDHSPPLAPGGDNGRHAAHSGAGACWSGPPGVAGTGGGRGGRHGGPGGAAGAACGGRAPRPPSHADVAARQQP